MANVIFGVRTGLVFVDDFDLGVAKTMGGELYTATTDDGITTSTNYALNVPGVCADDGSSRVPIVFSYPEQPLNTYRIPSILIRRLDATPAMNRWHSIGQKEYRVAAESSSLVTGIGANNEVVSGHTFIEEKVQAFPFDLSYELQIVARLQSEANRILRKILRVYKPFCKVDVTDSLGENRSYTAQVDGGIPPFEEVADISDRIKGYTIPLLIEGELDLVDPEVHATATGFTENVGRR